PRKRAPLYQGDPEPHTGGPANPHRSQPAEERKGVSPRASGVRSRGACRPGAVLRRGTRRDGERGAAISRKTTPLRASKRSTRKEKTCTSRSSTSASKT